MARQLTAIRMSSSSREHTKHIEGCAYVELEGTSWTAKTLKVASIVAEIRAKSHTYFTRDYLGNKAVVEAVLDHSTNTYYLRTTADTSKTDNLLRLPRYA